ncbi:MAG: PHP-associated domain-containing protein [Haloarculaceae archaeon]
MHVKVLDETVVQRAKARGLDALVYAPHFTRLPEVRKRAERFADAELRVFPARELFTGSWQDRRHVLAIGLSEPVPDFLTLEATMAELERQDAAVLAPHPGFLTVSLGAEELERYADVVDAVEVYNPKHLPHHNRRARRLASEGGFEAFTSSYAHLRGTVGEAWTAFEEPVETTDDLVAALRSGAPRRVCHRSGGVHQLRCALEFAHLGYENSWKKFDRVMLQGTEPTHPDHVAYDGRFDDVKVY